MVPIMEESYESFASYVNLTKAEKEEYTSVRSIIGMTLLEPVIDEIFMQEKILSSVTKTSESQFPEFFLWVQILGKVSNYFRNRT